MSSAVLFIAGPMGAGKSTLARALLEFAPSASTSTFSRGLRRLGAQEGVPLSSRRELQDYGEKIAQTRWRDLWNATTASAESLDAHNLVIDGLRHPHILRHVRQLADTRAFLLTLFPTSAELVRRRTGRGDIDAHDDHIVESRLGELAGMSDIALRGRVADELQPYHLASLLEPIWATP